MDEKAKGSGLIPNECSRLLALAALFEGNFSIDWMAELGQKRPSQILSALEEGIRENLLLRKEPGVFCFKSPEDRSQYHGILGKEERENFNSLIVRLFIKELPEDEHKAISLIPYLLRISNNLETCHWLVRAGDDLLKAFHVEKALHCYKKALSDLYASSGEKSDFLFTETSLKYAEAATVRYHTRETYLILRKAITRSIKRNYQFSQALLKMHLGRIEWLSLRFRKALQYFNEAFSIATALNNPKLLELANIFKIRFANWQGKFYEVIKSYEMFAPGIQKFPSDRFPLGSALTVGLCYARIGQVTQGLGMLDAIRTSCQERGDQYEASRAELYMGITMLDLGQVKEALKYLHSSMEKAKSVQNEWVWILATLVIAYGYYLSNRKDKAISYLKQFSQNSNHTRVSIALLPYNMDLCWAMEQRKLPQMPNFSLKKIIHQMIEGENIFLRGVAYRYRAELEKAQGVRPQKVIQTLNDSIRWLEESGYQVELAKSKLERVRMLLLTGEEDKAQEEAQIVFKTLSLLNEELIPEDLKSLRAKTHPDDAVRLEEILTLSQQIATIRDSGDLVQQIISTVNHMTGAERGAIFLCEKNGHPSQFILHASKNITPDQIAAPEFTSSMGID